MDFPDDLRYSANDEWVRVDGGQAVVGITDYAQDALGDVVFVQLPERGARLEAGSGCALSQAGFGAAPGSSTRANVVPASAPCATPIASSESRK